MKINGKTVSEILRGYAQSEEQFDDIEAQLPLLTIIVPELPSGFSADSWNAKSEIRRDTLNGNPIASYDQTWVTYGSRLKKDAPSPHGFTPIDHYDILDDQIFAWINAIAKRCRQVVFVSDSCHSGSVSRSGIAAGIRRGPKDRREHPLGKRKYTGELPKNVIRIGAGKDSQLAREFIPVEADRPYGIFTWYWSMALEKCRPDDSWSHIFNRVARIVYQETPNRQIPQIEGAVSMKVFGADFLSPAQTVSVYQVIEKGAEREVYLAAGSLSGVTKGSVYTLEDKVKNPDAPRIVVTGTKPDRSIGVAKADIKRYDQLVEISHRHNFLPARLLLKAEHEKDKKGALAKVRKVIEELAPYEITADEKACDLVVYLFRPKNSALAASKRPSNHLIPPPASNAGASLQIWILNRDGFLHQENLRHACSATGLGVLRRNLLRLARVKDIMQVVTPQSTPPLTISVTPAVPVPESEEGCEDCIPNQWPTELCGAESYKLLDPLPLQQFLANSWDLCTLIHFNAQNPTRSTYYFYVVYIGSHAEIVPLYPGIEDRSEIAEVSPGSMTVRSSASMRLDTKTLDHYKLIICKKPINHLLLTQSATTPAVRGGRQMPSHLNPLERILLDALSGKRNQISYKTGSRYAETIAIDMR